MNTQWLEGVIETASPAIEPITGYLMTYGIHSIQIEDAYDFSMFLKNNRLHWDYADPELLDKKEGPAFVKFYLPAAGAMEKLKEIEEGLEGFRAGCREENIETGVLALKAKFVDGSGWLDNWKKYYKPFKIGKRLVIKPSWENYVPGGDEAVINIDPGHVFGTGLHQSTRLCLASLENNIKPGDEVLDLGCGSGILSIAALMLGAANAVALDIDPCAADIVRENGERNGMDSHRLKVLTGNPLSDEILSKRFDSQAGKYQIILANIIADVVIAYAGFCARVIRPGGTLITGGIIKERGDEVREALAEAGFETVRVDAMDEWLSITVKMPYA